MRLTPFKKQTFFFFLFLLFLGFGFLGTQYYVQHEKQFSRSRYSTAEILRSRALSHRLRHVEYRNASLESEITELSLQASGRYSRAHQETIQQLSKFIGLVPQEGPGVEVLVKDSSKPLLLGDDPNVGIVHNTDLAEVVNDLRAAGATAVAINGQPVTSMTGINCSGPIIVINGTRVASPFKVQALGNPEKISAYLNRPTSFVKSLSKYGIETKVMKAKVAIPAAAPNLASSS